MAGFLSIPVWTVRVGCLCAAILVYALCGSPTPDHPGLAEIIIAALLVIAVGVSGITSVIRPQAPDKPFWMGAGKSFLLYGLTVPSLLAVMHGNDAGLILRDLLPFLFFLLPLFLFPLLQQHPKITPYLVGTIIMGGLLFSLRAVYTILPWQGLREMLAPGSDELFYFANAPTVLFATLMLIGFAGYKILYGKKLKDFIAPAGMLALSMLPLAAMTMAAQRASLGTVVLYVALLALLVLWKRPERFWRAALLIAAAGVIFLPDLTEISRAMLYKTREVGLNMRAEEALAVWRQVSERPSSLLFGEGWGGTFHSPAVGGVAVNFSHSLVTSLLLKTGLMGVFLGLSYIAGLLAVLVRVVLREPVQGLALAAPVMIDVLFYASFKSFDFGLVLALVPASLLYLRESQAPSWPVIEKREEADFWSLYADNRVEICLDQASSL